MAGVNLKGFDEFREKLKKLPKELKQELGGETFAAAKLWEQKAKMAAPVDQGRLRGAIRGSQTGEMSSKIVCNVDYAAYLEWGTKRRVNIPPELSEYAAEFRGNTSGGTKAKEMIYAWMKRIGIPEELQWKIFVSIIVRGIKPHPFFFIHAQVIESELIKNVRNILNTEH